MFFDSSYSFTEYNVENTLSIFWTQWKILQVGTIFITTTLSKFKKPGNTFEYDSAVML